MFDTARAAAGVSAAANPVPRTSRRDLAVCCFMRFLRPVQVERPFYRLYADSLCHISVGAMRASRLLTILLTLQLRGRSTAQALADRLEVSRRTIYRDVDELTAAGVPIYAERGSSGGFMLLDGFRTGLTALTSDESEALMLAGVPAAAADLGLGGQAGSAWLKLLSALPDAGREGADRMSSRFHLDVVDWYRRRATPGSLRTVAAGVWADRMVEFRYESWRRTSRVVVDPLGLVLKAGCWYLVARTRGRLGTYRLDKIFEAQVLEDGFDRPAGFVLAEAWRDSVASFERSLRRQEATIRVSPTCLDRLDRLGADIAERVLAAEPDDAGLLTASVPIEGIGYAAGLLLGLGDEVEVLEPSELRSEIARLAAGVVRLYHVPA